MMFEKIQPNKNDFKTPQILKATLKFGNKEVSKLPIAAFGFYYSV